MTSGRLQIKHLSHSGELLECINCFPGQVTVFRAHDASDLEPYRSALSGRSGPERFSILINDVPYQSDQHILIGFGDPMVGDKTVTQLFSEKGVSGQPLHSLLLNYGLEDYSQNRYIELSECAKRRVLILLAIYSNPKLLILDNPFEPIASQWKERFAELVLNDTRSKNRITVLTRLSFRPQSWIGNELIARVQVGQTVQKTIGFGTAAAESETVVNELRKLLKDESAVKRVLASQGLSDKSSSTAEAALTGPKKSTELPPSPQDASKSSVQMTSASSQKPASQSKETGSSNKQTKSEAAQPQLSSLLQKEVMTDLLKSGAHEANKFYKQNTYLARTGLATLLGLFVISLLVVSFRPEKKTLTARKQPNPGVARTTQEKPKSSVVAKVKKEKPAKSTKPAGLEKLLAGRTTSTKPSRTKLPKNTDSVLDQYPERIKASILAAFNDSSVPTILTSSVPSFTQPAAQDKTSVFNDLGGLPEGKPSASKPASSIFSRFGSDQQDVLSYEEDDENLDDRQKKLRQKFMDAINRAVEAKNNASM